MLVVSGLRVRKGFEDAKNIRWRWNYPVRDVYDRCFSCQAAKMACTLEKLRACGADYLPFGKRSQIATSGAPFVKQCRTYKEQILCSRNFVNDCLIDVFKDAAILALDSYKASIDEICTPGF
ncbi:hypothetical protein MRX96_001786 [Rhipicephalus microplus]